MTGDDLACAAALLDLPGMTPVRLARVLDGFGPVLAWHAVRAGAHPGDRSRRFTTAARQVDPASAGSELTPPISLAELWERMAPIYAASIDDADRRRRLGALALSADTVAEPVRRRVIEARLDGLDWVGDRLRVVVVEATSGDRRVLDATSGVDLVDAVTASCAVPGVWPPVTIAGSRFIDGGVWSTANADLAVGCDRVLVLAPIVDPAVRADVARLAEAGRVELIRPDDDSLAAFGADVLDPSSRGPSARAGRAQGRREAGRVADLLAD